MRETTTQAVRAATVIIAALILGGWTAREWWSGCDVSSEQLLMPRWPGGGAERG
jgi:hypothetical protein